MQKYDVPEWATQVVSRIERRSDGIRYSVLLEGDMLAASIVGAEVRCSACKNLGYECPMCFQHGKQREVQAAFEHGCQGGNLTVGPAPGLLVWEKEVLFGVAESRHAGCYAFQSASREQDLIASQYADEVTIMMNRGVK